MSTTSSAPVRYTASLVQIIFSLRCGVPDAMSQLSLVTTWLMLVCALPASCSLILCRIACPHVSAEVHAALHVQYFVVTASYFALATSLHVGHEAHFSCVHLSIDMGCVLQCHGFFLAIACCLLHFLLLCGTFCAHHCCECQGMKLVKFTDLASMWKYRKKQKWKVRYWRHETTCILVACYEHLHVEYCAQMTYWVHSACCTHVPYHTTHRYHAAYAYHAVDAYHVV